MRSLKPKCFNFYFKIISFVLKHIISDFNNSNSSIKIINFKWKNFNPISKMIHSC